MQAQILSPEIEDVDSPLVEQTPPKSPAYHVVPVKQHDTLHNFLQYINQGTFGIPCEGKVYCSSLALTLLLGLERRLLACQGPWHSLLIRISRRNLQIALQLCYVPSILLILVSCNSSTLAV